MVRPSDCEPNNFSMVGIFTAKILLLKKIARVAP